MTAPRPVLLVGADPAEYGDDGRSDVVIEEFSGDSVPIGFYAPWAIRCPSTTSSFVTAHIGPMGGTLELRGHRLHVPPGALAEGVDLTLTALAGPSVRVRLSADRPIVFALPVDMTISYAHCPIQLSTSRVEGVWVVDPATGRQEYVPAEHDPIARTIHFPIIYLSTYAVAY